MTASHMDQRRVIVKAIRAAERALIEAKAVLQELPAVHDADPSWEPLDAQTATARRRLDGAMREVDGLRRVLRRINPPR